MTGARGAVVACFGTRRAGQPTAADQLKAATDAGAVAVMRVDDMGFTIEPPRWPLAYARTVVPADGPPKARSIPSLRIAAAAFTDIVGTSSRDGADLLAGPVAARVDDEPAFALPESPARAAAAAREGLLRRR